MIHLTSPQGGLRLTLSALFRVPNNACPKHGTLCDFMPMFLILILIIDQPTTQHSRQRPVCRFLVALCGCPYLDSSIIMIVLEIHLKTHTA